jgi:DNA-binding response OmpR family regulator
MCCNMGWGQMAATAVKPGMLRRVLIVEDDHSICELLSDILDAEGFLPVCVATDREAYSILPTVPAFTAMLVDINLGTGTTGFDVARFARQVIPSIAVIYVTGQATEESFRSFGVSESKLVLKPFTADEMLAVIHDRLPANDD